MNTGKKVILITGAAGFIGKNTAKYFHQKGRCVLGAGMGQWDGDDFKNWGIEKWYPGTITPELLAGIDKKPDTIIHCAGGSSVGFSVKNPKKDLEMTMGSLMVILEFMRKSCPDARLIYPSSAAVYGKKPDSPIKEIDDLEPVSPYGIHKKMAEELCEEYSKKYKINTSIARLFSVYGPGLQKQLLWDASCKISAEEEGITFFGTGLEKRDWIHVCDVANLFFILSQSKYKLEIINGGSGLGVTVKEIIFMLLKAFKKKKNVIFSGISKEGDPEFYTADIKKGFSLGWTNKISLLDGIQDYVNKFTNKSN